MSWNDEFLPGSSELAGLMREKDSARAGDRTRSLKTAAVLALANGTRAS